ncbi:MAG: DUF1488 family protein [Bordetella sp.]|nr:DUF1488 family protein [Bordetella sp.]
MTKFTKDTGAHVRDDTIVFQMETGGVVRDFEISGAVLREHFGAGDDTPAALLAAFERGADELREIGKRSQWVPADGPIELGAGDFEAR